jgi:hypothetical protein
MGEKLGGLFWGEIGKICGRSFSFFWIVADIKFGCNELL